MAATFLRQMGIRRSNGRRLCSNRSYEHAISELNKVIRVGKNIGCIFEYFAGERVKVQGDGVNFWPATSDSGMGSSNAQEPQSLSSPGSSVSQAALSHVSTSGQAMMVDVSAKEDSTRVAVASCRVLLGQKAFDLVAANQISKGDVLTVAKIAGINGAKQTSNLIPLCHNIGLTHIRVNLTLDADSSSVVIEGEAGTTGKTGVEMEAMTAVAVAGLTVYDMCKAASKDIQITDVRLERKTGGKSGECWRNN